MTGSSETNPHLPPHDLPPAFSPDIGNFDEVYGTYFPRLVGWARRKMPAHELGGMHSPESIAQDALLAFYEHLEAGEARFASPAKVRNWLFTVALNDVRTARQKDRTDPREPDDMATLTVSCAGPSPEEVVSRRHMPEQWQQLPEDARQLLWQYYIEGLSHQEIGRSMDPPLNANLIRQRLHRARVKARHLMSEDRDTDIDK